jgi:hypothetical protein
MLPIVSDHSLVSGGVWFCPLRSSICEIVVLAWLPSCVWCPHLLNRWTRRRLVPDPVGGSCVDIVSFGLFLVDGRLCDVRFGVMLLSVVLLLYSLFAWVIRPSRQLSSECLLVFFCFVPSAATVDLFSTVFFLFGCLFVFRVWAATALARWYLRTWIGGLCES